MSCLSPFSTLTSHFSLLSHFSPFPSKSHRHSLLPTHHHPETFLVDAGDKLVEALKDPVVDEGLLGRKERRGLVIFLSTLTDLSWVCDVGLCFAVVVDCFCL